MTVFWIVLVFCAIGYGVAFTRKGKVATDGLGSRRQDLHSPADPATVFARLAALDGRIKVDDKDPATKILVLSSPVSFFTWGFLYPVYLHPAGTGTRIEVGCKSKFFQLGPLVTRAHDACVREIEAALALPEARVA